MPPDRCHQKLPLRAAMPALKPSVLKHKRNYRLHCAKGFAVCFALCTEGTCATVSLEPNLGTVKPCLCTARQSTACCQAAPSTACCQAAPSTRWHGAVREGRGPCGAQREARGPPQHRPSAGAARLAPVAPKHRAPLNIGAQSPPQHRRTEPHSTGGPPCRAAPCLTSHRASPNTAS